MPAERALCTNGNTYVHGCRDREYSDVYAFRLYVQTTARYNRNMSLWVSPSPLWTNNGRLCISNYTPPYSTIVPNVVVCANPISNTRYVILGKSADPINNHVQFQLWEMQVLRSGAQAVDVIWVGVGQPRGSLFQAPSRCLLPQRQQSTVCMFGSCCAAVTSASDAGALHHLAAAAH